MDFTWSIKQNQVFSRMKNDFSPNGHVVHYSNNSQPFTREEITTLKCYKLEILQGGDCIMELIPVQKYT